MQDGSQTRSGPAAKPPTIYLLLPTSLRTEFAPIPRTRWQQVRTRVRRHLDRLGWTTRAGQPVHYSAHVDHYETNRGDIAIRLASRELLVQVFGAGTEFIEIGWSEVPDLDPDEINARADLFVIGGGGYFYFNSAGALSERIPRDLALLRALRCPIVSLASGVNQISAPVSGKVSAIQDEAQNQLREILHLLTLSSVRDRHSQEVLDAAVPGHTVVLPDPALFLSPAGPIAARPSDGSLHIGLNIAFHGPHSSRVMPDRVRLFAAALQKLAQQRRCRFTYFVHHESERLLPSLLRRAGVPVTAVVDKPSAEMVAQYHGLDLMVCQMLHSSIFCLNAGVPAINVSYDVKNAAFFELMGLEPYCLPGETTTPDVLHAAIERALRDSEGLRQHIAVRRAALRSEMDAYLAHLVELVSGPSPAQAAEPGVLDRGLSAA